jgi:multidrug efflux pump subunit AcrA (membrane-fusion protein)
MSDGSGSNSSVKIVAILAVVVLVGVAAWFIWGRSGGSRVAPATSTTSQPADADINVKVDLPDTVTISR